MASQDVRILEGGLPKWIAEGRPLEYGEAHAEAPPLHAAAQRKLRRLARRCARGARDRIGAGRRRALRPSGSAGDAPEPRPGLKSGHMPGSLNLPFADVVEHGRLKPPTRSEPFSPSTRSISRSPIITTCGSGVSAAILALAVEEAGGKVAGLYDGSWAEWGGRDDCPAVTGPA